MFLRVPAKLLGHDRGDVCRTCNALSGVFFDYATHIYWACTNDKCLDYLKSTFVTASTETEALRNPYLALERETEWNYGGANG